MKFCSVSIYTFALTPKCCITSDWGEQNNAARALTHKLSVQIKYKVNTVYDYISDLNGTANKSLFTYNWFILNIYA